MRNHGQAPLTRALAGRPGSGGRGSDYPSRSEVCGSVTDGGDGFPVWKANCASFRRVRKTPAATSENPIIHIDGPKPVLGKAAPVTVNSPTVKMLPPSTHSLQYATATYEPASTAGTLPLKRPTSSLSALITPNLMSRRSSGPVAAFASRSERASSTTTRPDVIPRIPAPTVVPTTRSPGAARTGLKLRTVAACADPANTTPPTIAPSSAVGLLPITVGTAFR